MKKTIIIVCILSLTFTRSFAQINNLVPNPSFEDYYLQVFFPGIGCDTGAICKIWVNPTICTPDYYNKFSCQKLGVPFNERGFQYAYDGIGYYFLETYWEYDTSQFASTHRDYIQVELNKSLTSNKRYCVSFYVSLADSSFYANDRIGAYFSDTAISRNDTKNFEFIPQICSTDSFFINDKTNWIQIKGNFTSLGGERFITIGNFYDGYNTHVVNAVAPIPVYYNIAGYYIDMVSVYACDDTIIPEPEKKNVAYVPNIFSPNSDGTNDILYVRGENISEVSISIYNRWGEKVFSSNDRNKGWDGSYKGKPCPAEVYVYYVNITFTNGEIKQKKGNVTLVR